MVLIAKDPRKLAWDQYSNSDLSHWLRYDTWSVRLGLCLICDIDPDQSNDMDFDSLVDMTNIRPKDRPAHPIFDSVVLLSENSIYNLPPDSSPDDSDVFHALQRIDVQNNHPDGGLNLPDIVLESTDILARMKRRHDACAKLGQCWAIFASNPAHFKQESFAPSFFINWARQKEVEVPWLDWSRNNGYLDKKKGIGQPEPKASPTTQTKNTSGTDKAERQEEMKREIGELRTTAKKVAIKLKVDGIQSKSITVARICKDLFEKSFSNGKPFSSRWGTIDGMRSHLKGAHHPTRNKEFREAKSDRGNFNG